MQTPSTAAPLKRLVYTIEEACQVGGFKKTTAFLLIKSGRLEAVKLNHRTLIRAEVLESFLASLPKAS